MNGKLIITGAICFILGFITSRFFPQSTPSPIQELPPAPIAQAVVDKHQSSSTLVASALADKPQTPASASAPSNSTPKTPIPQTELADNQTKSAPATNTGKLKFTQRTELSDESIDELVPKPFNGSVKRLEPGLKTKFANYLLSENQTDSDARAESFLNDALNRGQLAGIAEVNLIACKAGLCELRLLEQTVNQTMPHVFQQLIPYRDYLQVETSSMTSDGQQTSIHYLLSIKR